MFVGRCWIVVGFGVVECEVVVVYWGGVLLFFGCRLGVGVGFCGVVLIGLL